MRLAVLVAVVFAALQQTSELTCGGEGEVAGVVTFHGAVPRSRVADNGGQRRNLIVVDRKTRGVRDVMVYLEVTAQRRAVATAAPPVVDQREHRFVPHLLAIRSGQKVKFTNSDAANHNVHAVSLDERNTFNIYTPVDGEYQHVFFSQRKNYPIRLSCDIHPWMTGWIFVFEHAHFAVTDRLGRFRIENLPEGDHQLVLRQPDVGYLRRIKLTVKAGESSSHRFELSRDDLRLLGD